MALSAHSDEFIDATTATTLPALFAARVARSPRAVAYQQYDSAKKQWHSYTWQAMHEQVSRWRDALAQEDLERGDRVALMVNNSVEWVCFDQAAQALGLVVVALYTTDTPDDIVYILADAGARLLLLENRQQWEPLQSARQPLSTLHRVWYLQNDDRPRSPDEHDILRHLNDILPTSGPDYTPVESDPDALATIVYTSGTTGPAKGVMLSHRNILANADAVQGLIPAYPDDVFLSFLPLAHAFERTVEYYLPIKAGSQVVYARSAKLLNEDLLTVRPTVLLAVPRLYEKIYTVLQQKLITRHLQKLLFSWTVRLGWHRFEADYQRRAPLGPLQRLLHGLLQHLVASKVLAHLGGRLRVAVTGAASMPQKVARLFIGLGVPLYEGYGLTEAGPVVSSNYPGHNQPGTVGVPLPGVEVKTAEDGELLVRSAGVMLGYWQREEATRQAVDPDGWLHTGDLASISDGIITIRGRIKDILVTSTGEKVPPEDMEAAIVLEPLFEQAMIVGEGKPYLSALLVVNETEWQKLARELQLDPRDQQALNSKDTKQAVLHKLAGVLSSFPGYAQVHAVWLSSEPWTIEEGLLTPTMKLKREAVERHHAEQITELYQGHVFVD